MRMRMKMRMRIKRMRMRMRIKRMRMRMSSRKEVSAPRQVQAVDNNNTTRRTMLPDRQIE